MSERALPTATPASAGVDARGVHAFLDALEAAPSIDPHGLVVLRHGTVVAQGWWAPYAADRVQLLYSLSKSFTSAAAGLAVGEGLMGLDDAVLDHFPEFDAEVTDPRTRALRVRHIAAMASGHLTDAVERAAALDPGDLVHGFLLLPPEREPGSVFAYNQPATHTLGAIVARASGQTLTEYLRPRLLDPLGIGDVAWLQHPAGRDLGFSGLHASTRAVAALGQLHLQGGAWAGRQVLDPAWVAEATRQHVRTPDGPAEDWSQGYGFQFWRSRHGYRGDGAYGQFCLVLPEQDAVVAITSETRDMQLELDLVWQHLLPALGDAPLVGDDREALDRSLADRLGTLSLPPLAAAAQPVGPAPWDGARLAPAGGASEDQPSLRSVTATARDGGWMITLGEDGGDLTAALGTGAWAVSEAASAQGAVPLAVSGGWSEQGDLRFDVLFLETPHRLAVTCAAGRGTFTARWATTPLHGGPLRGLRAPR